MPNYAVLRADNKVENIIVAESLLIAETFTGKICIEYDENTYISSNTTWDDKKKVWFEDEPVIESPTE